MTRADLDRAINDYFNEKSLPGGVTILLDSGIDSADCTAKLSSGAQVITVVVCFLEHMRHGAILNEDEKTEALMDTLLDIVGQNADVIEGDTLN